MKHSSTEQPTRQQSSAAERAAASWNLADGVRRHGPAFAGFANAVGHVNLIRDPDLFRRSLVGSWPSLDVFVEDYVTESGLESALDALPMAVRPFAVIDRQRVVANLQQELIVVTTEEQEVWVFDAPQT